MLIKRPFIQYGKTGRFFADISKPFFQHITFFPKLKTLSKSTLYYLLLKEMPIYQLDLAVRIMLLVTEYTTISYRSWICSKAWQRSQNRQANNLIKTTTNTNEMIQRAQRLQT